MHKQSGLIFAIFIVGPPAIADSFYIGGSIGVSMIDDTVDAAITSPGQPGELPDEISINGRPFDSNETASGITIGWNANDWLAVELGYTDFGNTGQSLTTGFFGPVPLVTPLEPPIEIPPNFGGFVAFPISLNANAAALSVEEWSIAAKFSKTLISDLSANWSIGITRAQFDADGQLTINELVTLDPLVINRINLPYASPENETGFNFGLGFAWRFSDRFSADIAYRRHDTRVIDVETVTLQLIVTL